MLHPAPHPCARTRKTLSRPSPGNTQTRSSVPGQSPLPSLFGVDDVANAKAISDVVLNIHNSADNGAGHLEVRLKLPQLSLRCGHAAPRIRLERATAVKDRCLRFPS